MIGLDFKILNLDYGGLIILDSNPMQPNRHSPLLSSPTCFDRNCYNPSLC